MTPMLPLHHRDKYNNPNTLIMLVKKLSGHLLSINEYHRITFIVGTEGLEPPVLRFPNINDELQINNILSK